jgi:Mg-chelatase subunit ChlD
LGDGVALATAQDYVNRNIATNTPPTVAVTSGQWDTKSNSFKAGKTPTDTLQVQLTSNNQALFFGRVVGSNSFNMGATATAVVRPRDMMLVLDFSGSMNSHSKVDQLKSAVSMFLAELQEYSTQDRVGFIRYSTDATKESGLTYDLTKINNDIQACTATGWTDIGDGMQLGLDELKKNARDNASKIMILMTDGLANRPQNKDPKSFVLSEATDANAAGIDVVAISFGSDADTTLMQQVADIGNDPFFDVRGSVSDCEKELKAVFLKIAEKFKVKLVQ